MQLSATRKLFDKLPVGGDGQLAPTLRSQWLYDAPPLEHNPLGGWQGNLVTLQRRNCVMLIHEATRFPLFLPALTKPDFVEFNDRFVDALMNTLLKCGAEDRHMHAAHHYLRPLQVVAQCNRSAQGTLNNMKLDLEYAVLGEDVNVAEITGYRVGAWLADRPTFVKQRQAIWPREAFLELLTTLTADGTPAAPVSNVEEEVRELPDNVVSLQAFRKRL